MSSQSHDLHRALLRPFIIHTLRAAGFHGTKPAVLDTLLDLTERHLLLLASTTSQVALNSHDDTRPTLSDVRLALQECGTLIPLEGSAEEEWTELLRRPTEDLIDAIPKGGRPRAIAEKRKREDEDLTDVREFLRWFDGSQHNEIKRIAGMGPDSTGTGAAAVGVGGGVVHAEDFLERLKKRHHKGGDDSRLQGSVLGRASEDRGMVVEGGPVQYLKDWRPRMQDTVPATKVPNTADGKEDAVLRGETMVT